MIKFVLVSIAAILVILAIYTYNNQTSEKNKITPTVSEKKKEVKYTEEVSVVAKEEKEKKSSVKNITVKSPKTVSVKTNQGMENEDTIGKGLTLEGIDNAYVSDEEKEILYADIAYRESLNGVKAEVLSEEEALDLVAEDVKNGILP